MQFHDTTEDLSSLLDEIRLEIDLVSDTLIEHYIQRAIIEFCEESLWWEEDVGPLTVVDGITNYIVDAGKYAQTVGIIRVGYTDVDGKRVWLAHSNDESVIDPRFWPDSPFSFDCFPNDTLTGKRLNIICALKPKVVNGSVRVSKQLIEEYRDALIQGAKSKILDIPNKEWTDHGLAQRHRFEFESHCQAAMRHKAQGFNRVPRGVTHKARDFY